VTTKLGRKPKAYVSTWGETVPGLAKDSDGRWRIVATRQRFSDPDEHNAVRRFRQWERENAGPTSTTLLGHRDDLGAQDILKVDDDSLWGYFRDAILKDPVAVARKTGIPQLASLQSLDLPKPPVLVSDVVAAYRAHSSATPKARNRAATEFERFAEAIQARTLVDLTEDRLVAFRDKIVTDSDMSSSGTIGGYFSRLRGVLRIAKRDDLDARQIDVAVSRMQAKLYAPPKNVYDKPQPISREHFHAILAAAMTASNPNLWRAMLLMALNAALYMEDVCDLRWESIDLERKTFQGRRKKKGNCLRVATLWDETVAALKALPPNGSPYVFVSAQGTRYSSAAKINDFAELRTAAKVPQTVKWSHLRDGAYSRASNAPGVDEKYARLLAGHKVKSDQEKYVLRAHEYVKPACDAVYRYYFG
jgi:integrase